MALARFAISSALPEPATDHGRHGFTEVGIDPGTPRVFVKPQRRGMPLAAERQPANLAAAIGYYRGMTARPGSMQPTVARRRSPAGAR